MISFRKYFPPIQETEIIARRFSIRERHELMQKFGGDNWRKLKGKANVELNDGTIHYAELHWYECHGIGKRKMKIKRLLD